MLFGATNLDFIGIITLIHLNMENFVRLYSKELNFFLKSSACLSLVISMSFLALNLEMPSSQKNYGIFSN